ncbi:hypothetical protein QJQ45_007681 [Haematococcus lacustris]|nr:hypothetical protein QJQ45_007681 [Haematococcus lacustris]
MLQLSTLQDAEVQLGLTVERSVEIMSEHWHAQQIGILVACAYFKNKEGAYKEQTVYVMTDGKEQSAAITQAAVNQVVCYLLAEHDMDMRQLYMWSDGCAGQFKGAPAMRQHWCMAQRFSMPVWWSYGATAHFKGRHDSEGGVVKQWLRDSVKQLCTLGKKLSVKMLNEYCKAVGLCVPANTLRANLRYMAAFERPIAHSGTVRVPGRLPVTVGASSSGAQAQAQRKDKAFRVKMTTQLSPGTPQSQMSLTWWFNGRGDQLYLLVVGVVVVALVAVGVVEDVRLGRMDAKLDVLLQKLDSLQSRSHGGGHRDGQLPSRRGYHEEEHPPKRQRDDRGFVPGPRKIMMEPLRVLTATNQPVVITERRCGLLEVQKSKTNCNAVVMPGMLNGVDLILGVDWMHEHDAVLKVKHGVCTLFEALGESGKPVNLFALQPKHLPGFAAVAAMKEHWDSAAEIKLVSPGQAVRQLRKGCSSWLMLVKPGDAGDQEGWHQGSLAAAVAGCSEQSTKAEQDPWLVPQAVLDGLLSEYADVFGDMPPGLPPDRPVGHTIRTPPGAEAPYKRMYKLSPREEAEVKKQVAELLAKGLIEPSSSPYGAPILFVQKKDGSLRMCIDYRALNKLTVRDRYPLLRIDDLFDKLAGKRVFSSLDLQSGYHQIRITEEDVPKTAFLTPMGQFQFKVLCFGLTNAPATFQRMMNNVFKPLINECVLVYIDDILVMSNTPEEHVQHLRQVLQLMRENKFYAKLAKCEFNKTQLAFLGHIVGSKGIAVDPAKVQVVKEWPTPRNLKDLQAFLGLANYFRRFIPNFSSLAAPLTTLTSKQVAAAYDWGHFGGAELAAFTELKEALCSAPVLALPDFSKPFVVCTDASLVGTGGVLMQDGRPIAYTSKKMSPAETRYATGEQELLGIIRAVREWRCYLDGAVDVTILTDHNPLIYLQTQPNLSRRQVRWMEELSRYKYEIKYIPGATNVADPISRNPALANEVALTSSSSPQNADSEDAMTVIMTLSSRAERPVYAITTRRTAARLRENAELGQVAAREAAQRANQLVPPEDLAAAHTQINA